MTFSDIDPLTGKPRRPFATDVNMPPPPALRPGARPLSALAMPVKGIPVGLGADYGDARLGTQPDAPPPSLAMLGPVGGGGPDPLANPYLTTRETITSQGNVYDGSLSSLADTVNNNKGYRKGGMVKDYRKGGMAKGPGTATSDSISANVSKGEGVLTAEAVQNMAAEAKMSPEAFIQSLNQKYGAKGYARGGVVDDSDVTDWNKLVDQTNAGQVTPQTQPLARTAGQITRAAVQGPLSALANAASAAVPASTFSGVGNALSNFASGFSGTPPVRPSAAYPNPLADPSSGLAADTANRVRPGYALANVMPNATGGQAQVRKVDNALAAASDQSDLDAMSQRMEAARQGVNYATAGNGFALRDAIRGGAPASALAAGALVNPAGAGRVAPGMSFNSDYGYGDNIKATADTNGKVNSFSGTGGSGTIAKPSLADYAAGLSRAAANREQLAGIEAQKNALPILAQMTPQQAIDTAKANAGIAETGTQTRARSAGIVENAGEQPYTQGTNAAKISKALADIGYTQAQTGEATERSGLYGAQADEAQQRVAEQKIIGNLHQQFLNAPDDKTRAAIGNKIITLKGLKPEEWSVQHLAGGTDPQTQAKIPDVGYLYNKTTGEARRLDTNPAGPPPGKEGDVMQDKAGNKVQFKNGKWTAI